MTPADLQAEQAAPGVPTGAREPIVQTRALTKRFGTTVAVGQMDLTVEAGSITGIVGPNGAGKSTLFLMLATLLAPDAGEARVCGRNPVIEPLEVRRRLGYMPDFFGIYDDLRVDEYLDFFAASYGIKPTARAALVGDLLELVDLSGKREALVNTLSRGMKQRLCLARALVHDPELLILDEPASGLDPRARIELRSLLLELQRMGKTILISSHILSELEDVCSHVVILEAGRLVAQGSPRDIASGLAVARRISVRSVEADAGLLRGALARFEIPLAPSEQNGALEVELPGGDAEAAALLAYLVDAGVRVVNFSAIETGLEEIFMRITKGTVQ